MIYRYGELPVPWTVMWSEEEEFYVAVCAWFKQPAICQKEAAGQGVPRFGRPHAMRQRKAIALGLCDLCAKPLRDATKVALGQSGPFPRIEHDVQFEPLIHRQCAALSMEHCPSLRRQADEGSLNIRQVTSYRARSIPAFPKDRERYVPGCELPGLIGIAAVEIIAYRDRDLRWLKSGA